MVLRNGTEPENIVNLRTAGSTTLNLNQDHFKEVAAFKFAAGLRMVFTNRHQVNDSGGLSACRNRKTDATNLTPPFNFRAQETGFRELVAYVKQDYLVERQGAIVVREGLFQSDR
jgi:hypothetical protein